MSWKCTKFWNGFNKFVFVGEELTLENLYMTSTWARHVTSSARRRCFECAHAQKFKRGLNSNLAAGKKKTRSWAAAGRNTDIWSELKYDRMSQVLQGITLKGSAELVAEFFSKWKWLLVLVFELDELQFAELADIKNLEGTFHSHVTCLYLNTFALLSMWCFVQHFCILT